MQLSSIFYIVDRFHVPGVLVSFAHISWKMRPSDKKSHQSWVCCWFSSLLQSFFSRSSSFLPSTETNNANVIRPENNGKEEPSRWCPVLNSRYYHHHYNNNNNNNNNNNSNNSNNNNSLKNSRRRWTRCSEAEERPWTLRALSRLMYKWRQPIREEHWTYGHWLYRLNIWDLFLYELLWEWLICSPHIFDRVLIMF